MVGAVSGVDNIDRASGFSPLDYYDRMFLHNLGNPTKTPPVSEISKDKQESNAYYSDRRSDTIILSGKKNIPTEKNLSQNLTNSDFPEQKEKLDNIQFDWNTYQNSQFAGKNISPEIPANNIQDDIENLNVKENKKVLGTNNENCETCDNRKYVDISNDESVSFQIPTEISREQAAAKVRAHENEHIVNEKANAAESGRKVVSQSVTINTDVCPECGSTYVSGGKTKTVTAAVPERKSTDNEKPEKTLGLGNEKSEKILGIGNENFEKILGIGNENFEKILGLGNEDSKKILGYGNEKFQYTNIFNTEKPNKVNIFNPMKSPQNYNFLNYNYFIK